MQIMEYYIEDRGERIAYLRAGSGRKVLILHGNRSSSKAMEPLIAPLAERYAVYAPDMPGFGKSTYRERRRRVEDYAEAVASFLEKLDLSHVTAVGWSFGGLVAMEAAKITPRIESMILLSSVGPEGIAFPALLSEARSRAEEMAEMGQKENRRERIREMLSESLFDGELPRAYVHLIEEALLQRNALDVYFAMIRYRLKEARDLPTLILHGRNDRVVSPQDGAALGEYYPRSRVEIFCGGHFLPYNDRDAVVEAIGEFIERIKDAG